MSSETFDAVKARKCDRNAPLALVYLLLCVCTPLAAADLRDRSLDADWVFAHGDFDGAHDPQFDDSNWRKLDLPHDWSIQDLPPEHDRPPELEAVAGRWRFRRGDKSGWKDPELDDSEWRQVNLPATWEQHSQYHDDYAFGWYRRRIIVPERLRGQDFDLLLGRIDDVDEAWLNGQRIGATGSFPPDYRTAWDVERRYRVPASLVRGDGADVLAVRVFDGEKEGGILAKGTKSARIGPFDPRESTGQDKTGYVLGGVGWYRKHFRLTEADKRVAISFDGVYMNADVWINGHHLGFHPYGYTGFEYDLAPYLRPTGAENVVAVRVRNNGKNSRWYSGSGIYRHVWLTVTDLVHFPTDGVFVTTPKVSAEKAVVKIAAEVHNETDAAESADVSVTLHDKKGRAVGSAAYDRVKLCSGETATVELSIVVAKPNLWSVESPYLYSAKVEVLVGNKVADAIATPFGVRSIRFDAEKGFRLNGIPLLLKGGCIHHDNGPLGAAAFDRAEERKVGLLKANGFNALRSSHNPPSPALLHACDRLGVLVIDEAFDQWKEHKLDNTEDYHRYFDDWFARDVATMVRRDRNHPSVIMWSIGNEIPEQFRAEETQLALRKAVLKHDDTRPLTQAICTDWGEVVRNWDRLSDPAFTHLDIAGYNYLPEKYESDHARHPRRMMYGSESYAKNALEYWSLAEEHPYVIGDFVWTAMDYLGESGLAHTVLSSEPNPFFMSWPWHNAWCGDLDLCGFKKPQSFYRDVVWRRSPIEMAVHAPLPAGQAEVLSWWAWPDEHRSWNWAGHEGKPLEVAVYTRCDAVRLELNGKVIGEKPVSVGTKLTAKFEAPYEPGELRALGLVGGEIVADATLTTSGPPARIKLTADRSKLSTDRNDLCFVTVEVVDASGQRVPNAEVPIHFSVSGAGEFVGQAGGLPNAPASFQAPKCVTAHGRCLAILRPTGQTGIIKFQAVAGAIQPATLAIECSQVPQDGK